MENNQATSNLATSLLMQLYTDYQKEKNKQSRWRVFYFILCAAFFVLLYNRPQAPTTIAENKAHVAVIRIEGAIGDSREGSDYKTLARLLHKAFEHADSKGVFLQIDSPGGFPYDSEIIYKEIRKLRAKHPEKKVICSVASTAASGAYWIAAGAEKIYAMPTSFVGSIGVRAIPTVNVYEFLKDHKIEPIALQAGKNKTTLNPFTKLDEQDIVRQQRLLDSLHQIFINGVKEGRGEHLDLSRADDLFSGEVWLAQEAKDLGLIDEIADPDEALAKEFGNYPPVLVEAEDAASLLRVLEYIKHMIPQASLFGDHNFQSKISLS